MTKTDQEPCGHWSVGPTIISGGVTRGWSCEACGAMFTLAATPSHSVEAVPDLSCPKCGVNSHDNNGEGWTHACDQRFVAALSALPDRFTVVSAPSVEAVPDQPRRDGEFCEECGLDQPWLTSRHKRDCTLAWSYFKPEPAAQPQPEGEGGLLPYLDDLKAEMDDDRSGTTEPAVHFRNGAKHAIRRIRRYIEDAALSRSTPEPASLRSTTPSEQGESRGG